MNSAMHVHGDWQEEFEPVVAAFHAGFEAGREVGAAMAVISRGESVVDVWSGHCDRRQSVPWEKDTLVCCFSVSKAITAMCIWQALDQTALRLDVPVAKYWPEFGAGGKASGTLRHILSHSVGVPGLRAAVPSDWLYDWPQMCEALAREPAWWEPGSSHGYHARTYGFLAGETLRRATGQTLQAWMQTNLTPAPRRRFSFRS